MRDDFDKGLELAQNTAKIQLEFIAENYDKLLRLRNGQRLVDAAKQFNQFVKGGEKLSPNSISYVDSIYEKVFKAAGFESCGLHIDKKKKGLRF